MVLENRIANDVKLLGERNWRNDSRDRDISRRFLMIYIIEIISKVILYLLVSYVHKSAFKGF